MVGLESSGVVPPLSMGALASAPGPGIPLRKRDTAADLEPWRGQERKRDARQRACIPESEAEASRSGGGAEQDCPAGEGDGLRERERRPLMSSETQNGARLETQHGA